MPYIDPSDRHDVLVRGADTPGELNYKISAACWDYYNNHGGPSYHIINEVIGVLECAKLEFYRRVAAPYEEDKCLQNGDIYV